MWVTVKCSKMFWCKQEKKLEVFMHACQCWSIHACFSVLKVLTNNTFYNFILKNANFNHLLTPWRLTLTSYEKYSPFVIKKEFWHHFRGHETGDNCLASKRGQIVETVVACAQLWNQLGPKSSNFPTFPTF